MGNFTFYRIRGKLKALCLSIVTTLLLVFTAYSQGNIAPLAAVSNSDPYQWAQINDLNLGTCGTQQAFVWTATPPSSTPGVDWMQWDFPFPRTFDTLVIHHAQTTGRFLTGALVQYWDGSSWVNHTTFSNLSQANCVNRVYIGKLTAARFRLTALEMNGTGQLSNPNFREIEIIEAPNGVNDAMVMSLDSPGVFCAGSQNVVATIGNMGINQIDSVEVHWEVNGVAQPSLKYIGLLDTIPGSNPFSAQVNLGSYTFSSGVSVIKIWTSLPNGVVDTIPLNDTLERLIGPALNGSYTVDQSLPTAGSNFNSITDLQNALKTLGMCDSVWVDVEAGTYFESLNLSSIPGLSASNHLTINGVSSSQARLIQTNSTPATLTFADVSHITVQNLTLENRAEGNAVVFDGAEHNVLQNCTTRVNRTSTSTIYNIQFVDGRTNNYNIVRDNYMIGGYYGIRLYGSSTNLNTYNQILDNEIDSVYYYGIYAYYQDSIDLVGNTVNTINRGNYSSYGIYLSSDNNAQIRKNRVWGGYMGMYLYNYNTYAPRTRDYEVINNMVYSSGNSGGYGYGLYMYYVDEVNLWHNSVHSEGSYASMYIGANTTVSISNYDIRNNIFSSAQSTAFQTNFPVFYNSFDYNIFNTGGATLIADDAGNYASLAAYQSSVTSWNINSLEGDPEFFSNTDLNILGTFPNDMGDPTTGVSEDIDGDARPHPNGSSVDIGADEYEPPSLDALITDLYNPGVPFCAGKFLVSAVITNYGLDTITSLKVYWDINGVLDSTMYTGSIPNKDTGVVVLDSITFVDGVPSGLTIYSAEPNNGIDGRTWNDTLDLSDLQPALTGNFTIDASQAASATNFTSFRSFETAVNSYGVCGPVNVTVAPDVYNDYLHLSNVPGLSATNTLTIDGGDSSQTILTQNGQSFSTLVFDGVDYVTVKNMTIENTGSSGDAVIFTKANHNQLTNCVSRVSVTSTSAYNIYFSSNPFSNSTPGEGSHNLIANNRIIGGYMGIYMYGSTTVINTGNHIVENEIDSVYYYGIYSYYGDSTEVIGNTIDALSRENFSSYGIVVNYTENSLVKKNDVKAGYMGIYLYNNTQYSTSNRAKEVSNNMVYVTGNTSGFGYGVNLGYVDEVNFWYNSIYHEGTYAGLYIISNTTVPISNYDVRNNIIASMNSTAFETNTSGFMNSFDYNIFYQGNGGNIITDPSNSYTTLASYISANPTFNVNSLQGDPEYTSVEDLHIYGILPNDRGDGSVPVYEDIDGDLRPSANGLGVDIGADEYDPPQLDASLSAIYQPDIPFCAGSYLASAVITNAGMDTLTFVKVYWELGGVLDSTTYTGSILTGDTGIVTLDSVTFNNGVAYDLKVYTADPNNSTDERNSNDTLEFEGLRTALSGTYTVDAGQPTSASNFESFADLSQALTDFGVCGPTRVNVAPDVYNEALFLSDIDGLSSSNYLIIDGGDSSQTILRQSTEYATLTFDGVSNVMVKNMTIEKSGSGDAVIFSSGAQHDTLSNCVTRVPISTSSVNYNITFSGTTTSHSTNSGVDYVVIQNNRIIGGYYGIWMYGSTGDLCRFNQVLNNDMDSTYYYGIYSFYNDSTEIVGNHVNMMSSTSTTNYGIMIYYDNNARVSANYSAAKYAAGYFYNSAVYAPNTRRYEISNNMFISSGTYGVYMYYVDSVDMFHNSINNYGSGQGMYIGGSTSIAVSGYDVRNNIFNTESSASAFTVLQPDTIFMKLDYNIYNSGGTVLTIGGTPYNSLAAYQTVQSLYNSSSLEGNPEFISNIDLHINGVFANDVGDGSVGITVDIDGDARPRPGASGVDIGADEFNPPTCPQPVNFTVSQHTVDTLKVTWTGINSPGDYEVELVACGAPQGTGTVSTIYGDSILVGGFVPNKCYSLYLREVCTRGDTSNWAGPIDFGIKDSCENFDAYTTGPVDYQSVLINGWEGAQGDAVVSTDYASSGNNSLKIHTSGINGYSDVIADLDNYSSGVWNMSVDFYIPKNYGGYYNILHNYQGASSVWAIEVYLDSNGTARVNQGSHGTNVYGTYSFSTGAWNTVEHIIDLNNDTAFIIINGVNSGIGWRFSSGVPTSQQFNAFNFYSAANAGQTPLMYFDNFCVTPYTIITSIADEVNQSNAGVAFYPNPTNGQLFIEANGFSSSNVLMSVTDINGKVVYEDNINSMSTSFRKEYDFSSFSKGVYFIRLIDGENQINHKLILH